MLERTSEILPPRPLRSNTLFNDEFEDTQFNTAGDHDQIQQRGMPPAESGPQMKVQEEWDEFRGKQLADPQWQKERKRSQSPIMGGGGDHSLTRQLDALRLGKPAKQYKNFRDIAADFEAAKSKKKL